jgi:hypothetical protein
VVESASAPETPFAVRVQVRPPHGRQPVCGALVKGIFDGVICAFQAHIDTTVLPDVVARIATVLPAANPVEIEELLLDQRRAVLGAGATARLPLTRGIGMGLPSQQRARRAGALVTALSHLGANSESWRGIA